MAIKIEGVLTVKDKGTAEVKRFGDTTRKVTGEAARDMQRVDRSTAALGKTAASARQMITRLFGGLTAAAAITATWRVNKAFELSMATVQGVTKATAEEFAALSDKARELGASTRYSAAQAADAELALARAGLNASQIMASVGAALNLAAGANMELGRAAEIVVNVLAQYGLAASEATRVTDVLTNTANRANTDVNMLAEAFKMAGPVAGALGVSVENTAAAVGVLSDAGLQASMAGTILRGVFTGLLQTTEEGAEALKDMRLTLEDLDPTTHNLIEIFEIFAEKQMTAAQALALFQRRNAAGALVLMRSVEKVRELTRANEEAEGAAQAMADVMSDTLNGAFLSLKSAIEEVMLTMGDAGFVGGMRSVLDTATEAIRLLLNMPGSVHTASDAAKRLAAAIEGIGTAAGVLIGLRIAAHVMSAARAMLFFNAATVASPWGALAKTIALAAGAFVFFTSKADTAAREMERIEQLGDRLRSATHDLRSADEMLTEALAEGNLELQRRALNLQIDALMDASNQLRKAAVAGESIPVEKFRALVPKADAFLKWRDAEIQEAVRKLWKQVELAMRGERVEPVSAGMLDEILGPLSRTLPKTVTEQLRQQLTSGGVSWGKFFESIIAGGDQATRAMNAWFDEAKSAIEKWEETSRSSIVVQNDLVTGMLNRRHAFKEQRDALDKTAQAEAARRKGLKDQAEAEIAAAEAARQAAADARKTANEKIAGYEKLARTAGMTAEEVRRLEIAELLEAGAAGLSKEAAEEWIKTTQERLDIAEKTYRQSLKNAEADRQQAQQAQEFAQMLNTLRGDSALQAQVRALQEGSSEFLAGLGEGADQFVTDVGNAFEAGRDLAALTANAMSSAFDSLFFDIMQGRIDDLGDAILSLGRSLLQTFSQAAFQAASQQLTAGLYSLLGATQKASPAEAIVQELKDAGLTVQKALQLSAQEIQTLFTTATTATTTATTGVTAAAGSLTTAGTSAGGALAAAGIQVATALVSGATAAAAILAGGKVLSGGSLGLGGGTWINPNVGAARGAILAGETVRTFGQGGLFAGQTVRAYGDGGIPGVYNRPTYFRTANEELGVLGERHRPEGILPLQEGPEGLGVRLYGGAGAVTQTFAPNITIQVMNPKSKAEAQAGVEAGLPAIRREVAQIAKQVFRAQARSSNSRSQISRMARSRV